MTYKNGAARDADSPIKWCLAPLSGQAILFFVFGKGQGIDFDIVLADLKRGLAAVGLCLFITERHGDGGLVFGTI